MKCLATIVADLRTSPLGMRSRLADALDGVPLIRRTVERVLHSQRIDGVCLIAPADQHAALGDLLAGLDVSYCAQAAPPPYHALVRAGRIWGLDGWRGGIGSLCCFDEDLDVISAAQVARQHGAALVASIPAAAPLLDASILDAMIEHYIGEAQALRLTFACAPPGIAGLIIARDMLEELAPTGQPPGAALTYQPDRPFADLTAKESCWRAPVELVEARGRLLADTHRSWRRVEELLAAGAADWPARRIGAWLSRDAAQRIEDAPEEIEIELTTKMPDLEASVLRPRPPEFAPRGPISVDALRSTLHSLGDFDDVRVVLAGFGDPCLHPEFPAICRLVRESGAAAVAVRTTGRDLPREAEESLFAAPIDVVEVMLDAATPQTYARMHGADAFEAVIARVDAWIARREHERRVRPLIVPSFVKSTENLDEMEAFYDHWQRRLGCALISGYSSCAGQRPDRSVTQTAPSPRRPCRRTRTRAMILADGCVTTCDQDFAGRQVLGSVLETPLLELWRNSTTLNAARSKCIADLPLCPACTEWHRP
ncbi:MAG: hypothetical protein DCC66_12520 [Planctomycetota bacterium]|nr:MAG: hypothetical protein DCC66_12520 [Planctomycetota bacterium]